MRGHIDVGPDPEVLLERSNSREHLCCHVDDRRDRIGDLRSHTTTANAP